MRLTMKKLGEYPIKHSKEYAQKTSEANRQHKILHINDYGKLNLVEQDFYKKEKNFIEDKKALKTILIVQKHII